MNEAVLRATDVTRIVILRDGRSKSLRTRFTNLVTYSEQIIDDFCPTTSMLDIAQFVAAEIMSGERVLLYETVVTASSWIVCGIILRILFPKCALPFVKCHLDFSQAFVATNSCFRDGGDGSTADLVSVDRLRRRRSALARTWIAIARRPAAAKAPWWPPHELVLRIAAAIDVFAAAAAAASAPASLGPLATPRLITGIDNGRAAGRVAAPAADRPAA